MLIDHAVSCHGWRYSWLYFELYLIRRPVPLLRWVVAATVLDGISLEGV